MTVRKTAGVSIALALLMGGSNARADDGWSPVSAPPVIARTREVIASTPLPAAVPAASLGRPVAVVTPRQTTCSTPAAEPLTPVSFQAAADPLSLRPAAPIFRGQAPDAVVPPAPGGVVPGPPPADIYANGGVTGPAGSGTPNFFGRCWEGFLGSCKRNSGHLFQSDHGGDLDQFASPVSSPFLTVDPRALTEIKPVFIYQDIPNKNDVFRGGSMEFFGMTGSIALTERWALVINKLGGIFIQPNDQTFTGGQNVSSFSELWLGPKYTFYRDECNKTVAAAGLTFQIPAGNANAFQNTGTLSLAPYVSFAKGFPDLASYGHFNFMNTTGFSFGTDNQRSDYFYTNFHLDFDVAGQHKFYPLIELNYTRYIVNGGATPFFSEGNDLINFGSMNSAHINQLYLAFGARYKFSEFVQTGFAFEFPLTNSSNGINDFRTTFDVILRY